MMIVIHIALGLISLSAYRRPALSPAAKVLMNRRVSVSINSSLRLRVWADITEGRSSWQPSSWRNPALVRWVPIPKLNVPVDG
jgi:hypothetical protein